LEFFGVIEILPHGVGQLGALVEDFEVELLGPPVGVAFGAGHGMCSGSGRERAFGFVGHKYLLN
jgi:hypothetical protein